MPPTRLLVVSDLKVDVRRPSLTPGSEPMAASLSDIPPMHLGDDNDDEMRAGEEPPRATSPREQLTSPLRLFTTPPDSALGLIVRQGGKTLSCTPPSHTTCSWLGLDIFGGERDVEYNLPVFDKLAKSTPMKNESCAAGESVSTCTAATSSAYGLSNMQSVQTSPSCSSHHQSATVSPADRNHRRRIDEILPGFLFLSGSRAAHNFELVRHNKIDAMLACARDAPLPPFVEVEQGDATFAALHLPMADAADTELEQHFGAAFEFLDAMREAGKRVLVYCREGKSRSASIVIAYLIRTHKLDYGGALEFVRRARKEIDPNFSFCSQLAAYSVSDRPENDTTSPSSQPQMNDSFSMDLTATTIARIANGH